MKITYYGHSCFMIESDAGSKIITDPYQGIGYDLPYLVADAATISHNHFDHSFTEGVKVEKIIRSAGKAQVKDIFIEGFSCFHDEEKGVLRGKNIAFVFSIDGVKVCHAGDLGERNNQELIKAIGKIDILLIPVGGNYTIDKEGALFYLEKIHPEIVIPMHYKTKDCVLDLWSAEEFIRGAENLGYVFKNHQEVCFSVKEKGIQKRVIQMHRTN